jgi:acyl carrier protein
MIENVLNIITENKPGVEISESTSLFETGVLDSFDLLIVVSEIESAFSISIPGELLIPEHFETPNAIFKLIEKIKAE